MPNAGTDFAPIECPHCRLQLESTAAMQKHAAACLTAAGFQLNPRPQVPAPIADFRPNVDRTKRKKIRFYRPPCARPRLSRPRSPPPPSVLRPQPPPQLESRQNFVVYPFGTVCPYCHEAFADVAVSSRHRRQCPLGPDPEPPATVVVVPPSGSADALSANIDEGMKKEKNWRLRTFAFFLPKLPYCL